VKANDTLLPDLWTPSQFEELQLQSLSALCTIAPLCINDYMTCQGNNRLLLLLDWCVGQGQFKNLYPHVHPKKHNLKLKDEIVHSFQSNINMVFV
jgi:hypothetical protein